MKLTTKEKLTIEQSFVLEGFNVNLFEVSNEGIERLILQCNRILELREVL